MKCDRSQINEFSSETERIHTMYIRMPKIDEDVKCRNDVSNVHASMHHKLHIAHSTHKKRIYYLFIIDE